MEGQETNVPVDTPEVIKAAPKKKGLSKTEMWLIWVLVAVFVLGGGYTAYAFRNQIPYLHKTVATSGTISTSGATIPVVASTGSATTGATTVTAVTDAGVTWQTPVVADLHLITASLAQDDNVYYQVGTDSNGGKIYTALIYVDGPVPATVMRFLQKSDGNYYLVSKNSGATNFGDPNDTPANYLANYNSKEFVDTTTEYKTLEAPDLLTDSTGAIYSAESASSFKIYADLVKNNTATKVATTNYGSILEMKTNLDKNNVTATSRYYLEMADTTLKAYVFPSAFMASDGTLSFTKTDGTKVADKYTDSVTITCGQSVSTLIAPQFAVGTGGAAYGTTTAGDTIYKSTGGASDSLIAAIYTNYGIDTATPAVSLSQYAAATTVLLWKNPLNEYQIYIKSSYQPQGECGKPVIYLYPQKTEQVSVKVGASITKSEPVYGDGWNVTASLDGSILYSSTKYPYLYWEGKGLGAYPEITQGFVVAQKDIKATLLSQLAQLGLNQKESADFMAFWLPKMPSTPYVRLTWFGTQQMNTLAPLTISPKPDTMIRIFLDFAGLNQPINIAPEKLSSVPRKGFTVVEWGGLLLGN